MKNLEELSEEIKEETGYEYDNLLSPVTYEQIRDD